MKPIILVLLLFIVIGIGLIIGGWIMLQHTREFIDHSVLTTGRIVDYIVDRDDDGTFYKPVVQFTTADGKEVEYQSSSGATYKTQPVGSSVRIHYDPANPQHAAIDSFLDIWFAPVILFVIGVFFIGIPATILIMTRGRL